jgi:hypothetical protein
VYAAEFHGAKLRGAELHGAKLYGVKFTPETHGRYVNRCSKKPAAGCASRL